MKRLKTIKQMNDGWEILMKMAGEDKEMQGAISTYFNDMLNSMLGDDFFGTEGQCDPRGDHRNDTID